MDVVYGFTVWSITLPDSVFYILHNTSMLLCYLISFSSSPPRYVVKKCEYLSFPRVVSPADERFVIFVLLFVEPRAGLRLGTVKV